MQFNNASTVISSYKENVGLMFDLLAVGGYSAAHLAVWDVARIHTFTFQNYLLFSAFMLLLFVILCVCVKCVLCD